MVIYLDSGDLKTIEQYAESVAGVTTNPSLLRSGGVKNYREFARSVLAIVGDNPVSFEVFDDDLEGMWHQAKEISSWGPNVYVKVPVTNTHGQSCAYLMKSMGEIGIKVNATAICAMEQIETVARSLVGPSILSIFCGRIADTGRDPSGFVTKAALVKKPDTQILWASTREVLNVKQAEQAGADIITMSPALILKMLEMKEVDLNLVSIMTVKQFARDAEGLTL